MKLRGFEKITSFKKLISHAGTQNKNGGRVRYLFAAGRYH